MDSKMLPLWKVLETPLVSLDESHVELFSLIILFLLSFVALIVKSRHRQWIRHLVQTISVLVFFYILYSCLGVFGMIRNTMVGISLIGTVFTESFFWMSLPIIVISFTLTSGPYFCGWICPTGSFQELSSVIREFISKKINPKNQNNKRIRSSLINLVLLAIFFFGFVAMVFYIGTKKRLFVEDSSLYWASSLIIIVYLVLIKTVKDEAIRGLRGISFAIIFIAAILQIAIVSPVHFAFANSTDPASALTTLVLVVASLFVSRAWCRYVCPWGYLMGCVHRVSRLRISKTENCSLCGTCSRICRVEAVNNGVVKLSQCQFCMTCVDKCPDKSLKIIEHNYKK